MENRQIRTLSDLFRSSVVKFSNQQALSYVNGTSLTYSDVEKEVQKVASFFIRSGIKKGDKIAILAENMPNWGVVYLAVTSMGAITVPILPDFQKAEVGNILNHSESKMLFVSEKLYKSIPESYIDASNLVILLKNLNIVPKGTKNQDLIPSSYPSIEESSVIYNSDDFHIDEEDIASIIYTSGTTGTSKGVMLSHKNIVSNVYSCGAVQPITTNDRFLSILPLSHTYENTLGFLFPFMYGASVFYLGQAPTANALIAGMQKVKPTIMLSVPLIIEKIFKAKVKAKFTANKFIKTLYANAAIKRFLHKLAGKKLMKTFGGEIRFFGIGGAPLSPEVEEFLIDAKFPYAIGYGLTETAPLLAGANPQFSKYRSTGPAVEQVELKISNPDENGEGEILAKGPNIMKGYYKDDEKTREVFTNDGWFKTGDLGAFDESNYLYIKGRLKNMILGPSGENIYPEEIEAVLNKYQYVNESLVFEKKGKIIAKVHLNIEELEKQYKNLKESATQMPDILNEIILDIHQHVNLELNKFSRLNLIMVQTEPFEKTPTKKIKRYLYTL